MYSPTEEEFVAAARERYLYDDRVCGLVDRETELVNIIPSRKAARKVDLLGFPYPRSDVVWMLHHGKMPPAPLEHINGDRTDDSFGNLGYKGLNHIKGVGNSWFVVFVYPGHARRCWRPPLGPFRTYDLAEEARDTFHAFIAVSDLI